MPEGKKQAELLGFGVGAFLRRRGAGRSITTAGSGVENFMGVVGAVSDDL